MMPAATVLTRLGPTAKTCRDPAYRLFHAAERGKLVASEATDHDALVVIWPVRPRLTADTAVPARPTQTQLAV